jgi:hypothetical protein
MEHLMEQPMPDMASKFSTSNKRNISSKSEQMLSCLLSMLPSLKPMVMAMLNNNIDEQAPLISDPADLFAPFL